LEAIIKFLTSRTTVYHQVRNNILTYYQAYASIIFMSEKSPFEKDIQATVERHFVETLDTIAKYSDDIVIETGEREDEPYTDILFVMREGTHTPSSLRNMQVELGLDSSVSAHITTEGNGLLVNTPLSLGRFGEIIGRYPLTSAQLTTEYENAHKRIEERAQKKNLDSARMIRDTIAASLGHTWTGN